MNVTTLWPALIAQSRSERRPNRSSITKAQATKVRPAARPARSPKATPPDAMNAARLAAITSAMSAEPMDICAGSPSAAVRQSRRRQASTRQFVLHEASGAGRHRGADARLMLQDRLPHGFGLNVRGSRPSSKALCHYLRNGANKVGGVGAQPFLRKAAGRHRFYDGANECVVRTTWGYPVVAPQHHVDDVDRLV